MPPRKAKRAATKKSVAHIKNRTQESKRVGLWNLLDMPVDILLEIVQVIHPRDLLNLSWSCKEIRAFLMQKDAAFLWKHCLRAFKGLPPNPKHVIEPAWVTLMFTTYCTGCGLRTTSRAPIWEFNVRFCGECNNTEIIKNDAFGEVVPDEMKETIPRAIFTPCIRQQQKTIYLRSEVEYVLAEWERISTLGDEAKLKLFVGERVLRIQKVAKHVLACNEWNELQVRIRKEEQNELLKRRLQAIVTRLRDLGWGSELDGIQVNNYMDLRCINKVYIARALTDQAWESMREDVVGCMQEVKKARIQRELRQRLAGRSDALRETLNVLSNLPEARACGLSRADIAVMPEIRDVMCAADSVQVDEESFRAVHENFVDVIEAWKRDAVDKLHKLVNEGPNPKTRSEVKGKSKAVVGDPLELATTKFYCYQCDIDNGNPLFYPGILAHRCLRDDPRVALPDDAYFDFIHEEYVVSTPRLHNPSEGRFFVNEDLRVRLRFGPVSQYAKAVITLCGKDPATATALEMDTLDVRLLRVKNGKRHVMSWRCAIWYDEQHHDSSLWRLVTPEERVATKICEDNERKAVSLYHCRECNTVATGRPFNYRGARSHMSRIHGVNPLSVDHEYLTSFLCPDGRFANGMIKVILDDQTLPSFPKP